MSRFDYTEFSPAAREANQRMTEIAKRLEAEFEGLPVTCRERSLALTKLEEAIMWGRKALRTV